MLASENALSVERPTHVPAPAQPSPARLAILAGSNPRKPEARLLKQTARLLGGLGVQSASVHLLSPEEPEAGQNAADALAERLIRKCRMLIAETPGGKPKIGLVGIGAAGAAALRAAAELGDDVSALAVCGADPEPAWRAIPAIKAPTMLAVCGKDLSLVSDHRRAYSRLLAPKVWAGFPECQGFADPLAAEQIAGMVAPWLAASLARPAPRREEPEED